MDMPALYSIRGRLTDLRRYINVHLYWQAYFGPTDRYEFWIRDPDGREHKFTINTRTIPARNGHDITLIVGGGVVRGMINRTAGKSVNYVRVDPPTLFRISDILVPPAIFVGLVAWVGDLGWLLFLPAVGLYFAIALSFRAMVRYSIERSVDRALKAEAEGAPID